MLSGVFRSMITAPSAFFDGLEDEEGQNCEACSESEQQRPTFFTCGDLPEPAPMQGEVDEDQGEKSIRQPCVDIPPLVP